MKMDIANDRKGIKQVALLMKLKITNNGDEDFGFCRTDSVCIASDITNRTMLTYYSTIAKQTIIS